jgi:hypothetical protein
MWLFRLCATSVNVLSSFSHYILRHNQQQLVYPHNLELILDNYIRRHHRLIVSSRYLDHSNLYT